MSVQKKAVVAALAVMAALGLAGCGESISERVENKSACESAGGVYIEYVNGFDYSYRDWFCDLSTEAVPS